MSSGGLDSDPYVTRFSSWSSIPRSAVVQIVIAAVALVAVGALGSRPTIFADTAAYVRQGEYWSTRLGLASPLAQPAAQAYMASLMPQALATFGPDATTVAAARSPVYGLFLFLLAKVGTLWLVAFVQALAAAALIRIAVRSICPDRPSAGFGIAIAVLATASSLPFFAAFAMPDVFGGLAILACTLLLVVPERLGRGERGMAWLLMTMSLAVHAANVPVVVALSIAALCLSRLRGHPIRAVAWPGASILVSVVLVACLGPLFQESFRRDTGFVWGRPPFLMTRMLLDGPGKLYLDATCPGGVAPTLCRFKDRVVRNEDDVLWKRTDGVFGSADYATRLQLRKEEPAFVAAALAFAPGRAALAAAGNGLRQLMAFYVDDPLADPARYIAHPWTDAPAIGHLLPGLVPCPDPQGCRVLPVTRMVALFSIEQSAALLVSLAVLGWAVLQARGTDDPDRRRATDIAMLLVMGVVLNAAACGMLSAVSARYQARVVWLVPFAAVLAALALVRAKRATTAP